MTKFFLTFLFSVLTAAYGQTVVKGKVTDIVTGEVLTGVNISIVNTTEGTVSNFEGNYTIKTELKVDSLMFSYIGYSSRKVAVKNGISQVLNIKLVQEENVMKPIVLSSKTNRALRIIERAQDAKVNYNMKNLNSYESENFTKVLIAINNVSEKNINKQLVKSVEGIFDTFNSISENSGKKVLPIFLSENLSRFYFNKNPSRSKEVIIGSRIKGVGVEDGTFLSQLLGSTFQQYNFNDNILNILEKNFISPISKSSFLFYNYKLKGSSYPYGSTRKIYQIEVTPKNSLDLAFTGYIWIEDSSFALTSVSLSVTKAANLNFVDRLKITQEYEKTDAGAYLPVKNRVLIDIAEITKVAAGMVAIFSTSSENIVTNKERSSKFFDYAISMEEDATMKTDEFWDSARHEELSVEEKRALSTIDTVSNLKIVKSYVELISLAVDGYKTFGKVDIGPYALLYNYNAIEGSKIRLGAKTNMSFSKKIILSGYGAWGFNDVPGKQFKYKGQFEAILSRKHWTITGISYRNDVELIGVTDKNYGSSAIFQVISVSSASQLNRAKDSRIWITSEFRRGWTTRVMFAHKEYQFEPVKQYDSVKRFNFAYYENIINKDKISSNFTDAALSVSLRWAPKEFYLQNDNERIRQSKPGAFALTMNYSMGMKGIFGSKFDYNSLAISIEKGISYDYWGRTDFTITGLKVFQVLPYPLLEVQRGNQSFMYSSTAYNLMNLFEFVTDQSVLLRIDHHFNGALLNRVPLMRKLKWREFVECRSVMGNLSQKNVNLVAPYDNDGIKVNPINNKINTEPYVEVAYGVENIFKVLQIVFIHRVTHLDNPNAKKFAVKLGISVTF